MEAPSLHLEQVMNKESKEKQEVELEKPAKNFASQSALSSVVLPQELIYDILTRVSLDHLLSRCRSVCKDWRRLTYDSKFKLIHSQRTPTISGYLIQLSSPNEELFHFISFIHQSQSIPSPSLDFLPRHVEILSSSSPHGLLCCISYNHQTGPTLYVCKPATREWQEIPNPTTSSHDDSQNCTLHIVVVVLRSNPIHYKLIRFSTHRCEHYEIFDSNNWKWRLVDNDDPALPDGHQPQFYLRDGILVHGAVHWLTVKGHISALNVHDERWRIIAPPGYEQLHDYNVQEKLVECEGELGCLYLGIHKRSLELWVVENYQFKDEPRWKRKYLVDLVPVYDGYNVKYIKMIDLYTKDIVLMEIAGKVIWYNCKTGTCTLALEVPSGSKVEKVHQIRSDLIPCNMRITDAERQLSIFLSNVSDTLNVSSV